MASKNENSRECFVNLDDDIFDNYDFTSRRSVIAELDLKFTRKLKCLFGSEVLRKKTFLNQTVLDIIKSNDYRAFKCLLESGYKLQVMNDKGQTALHLAFYYNSHVIFTLLKKDDFCKLIDNDYTDCNGLTHFHIACAKGHKKLVETLLKYTSDINVRFHSDPKGHRNGFTPFHFAITNCTRHRVQIMELLAERGADVRATDSLKRTALHLACRIFDRPYAYPILETSFEVMQILVQKYKIDVNTKDACNDTPLLCIFPKNYNELETYYLRESHESDFLKETTEKIEFFLKHGADITASNNDGNNVLHLILMILRRSRYSRSANLQIMISVYEGTNVNFIEFSHYDIHYEKMIEKILHCKTKVNVNAENQFGQTPLKLAVSCMNINIVKMLLQYGANVNSLKFDEPNFFCYLSIPPNYDVVKNLLNLLEILEAAGFDITLGDNLEVLKFLIHKYTDCKCDTKTYSDIVSSKQFTIYNLLCSGSAEHIMYILQNTSDDLDKNDFHYYYFAIGKMKNYLDCTDVAKINIDGKVKDLVSKLIKESIPPEDFKMCFKDNDRVYAEGPEIESVILAENVKLTDLLQMKPDDIPHRIVNNYFSREIVHEFYHCNQAIRGHMAKNIVRYYTIYSAQDYFSVLIGFSLPEFLYKKIINFINNEDILTMCLAAMNASDGCQL